MVCTTAFAREEFDRVGADNLVLVGDGPRRPNLERRAVGLPIEFVGFVNDRTAVAALLASADVAIAPGPHETFGLVAPAE